MMDYCRNCGANLEPGAKTCRRCGADVSAQPVNEDRDFAAGIKDMAARIVGSRLFWPLLAAALLLIAIGAIIAVVIVSGKNARPPEPLPTAVITIEPSPEATEEPEPEPSPEPKAAWVDIYRSFLEADPSVNSQLLASAESYGFEGTVRAELFALADINDDGEPELLLAARPEGLPGWNVTGDRGFAVERYFVCGIRDGRVTPLMCGGVDYDFYPLLLSVNDRWLLEQSGGEDVLHRMLFRTVEEQGSSLNMKYEFLLDKRSNSAGQSRSVPAERYYINDERITIQSYMEELFPEGDETLEYYPVFFRELVPGSLDDMEESWLNREIYQLGRAELTALGAAAGSGWLGTDTGGSIPCISEAYCISMEVTGESPVIVMGVDKAEGWEYVRSVDVLSVSIEGADSWVHSKTAEGLPEGQVYEYVVGMSLLDPAAAPTEIVSEIKLQFNDGTELTKTIRSQLPDMGAYQSASAAADTPPAQ